MTEKLSLNLVLVGCGKMGQAMLRGWQQAGILNHCTIIDPGLDPALVKADNVSVYADNSALPDHCDLIVFAVKPQVIKDVIKAYQPLVEKGALVVSIAAGTPIKTFAGIFGADARIIRTMPNTPAAIGMGVTALCPNEQCTASDKQHTAVLMSYLGETIDIKNEDKMNDVTAVSGSGPAYVFHLIEALTAAAEAQGFAPDDAEKLARQTVIGAAGLAAKDADTPAAVLRKNVTSPGGTTEAGLTILMDNANGLTDLMKQTVKAAADRSRALSD
jgi:pyrroline-5-carboxylate reductase